MGRAVVAEAGEVRIDRPDLNRWAQLGPLVRQRRKCQPDQNLCGYEMQAAADCSVAPPAVAPTTQAAASMASQGDQLGEPAGSRGQQEQPSSLKHSVGELDGHAVEAAVGRAAAAAASSGRPPDLRQLLPHTTAWAAACDEAVQGLLDAFAAIAELAAARDACSRDSAVLEAAAARLRPEDQAAALLQQAVSSARQSAGHHISPQALLLVSNHKLEWASFRTEGLENDASFQPYGELAGRAFQVSLGAQRAAQREQQLVQEAAQLPTLDDVDLRPELQLDTLL